MTVSIGLSTGAALNPAKVIGPGLVGKAYWPILPYLVGTLGGILAGGILCEYILFKGIQTTVEDESPEDQGDDYEKELPSYIRENEDNDDVEIRDDRDPKVEDDAEADVSKVMSEVAISSDSDDDVM